MSETTQPWGIRRGRGHGERRRLLPFDLWKNPTPPETPPQPALQITNDPDHPFEGRLFTTFLTASLHINGFTFNRGTDSTATYAFNILSPIYGLKGTSVTLPAGVTPDTLTPTQVQSLQILAKIAQKYGQGFTASEQQLLSELTASPAQ